LTGVALLLGSLALAGGATAATIGPTTTCSNGVDDTPGLGLICQVTVANRFTASGGTARVTVRECHGAAGAPTASCKTTVNNLKRPVTQVTQCNNSINGGGGTLRCSVRVTNTYVGIAIGATSAVTVNQCVGSTPPPTGCDPFPATTTGAAITQCNGSANGGTRVQLTCTATGRTSSHHVRINQCNGSANGGGALVICSASIANRHVAAPSSSGSTPARTARPTTPSTDALPTATDLGGPSPTPFLFVGICFLAVVLVSRRILAIRTR
jgi:hypothetical protein